MDNWQLVITGCGTSHGNPPWGWPEQWSADPRDRRRRSGAMLRGPQGQVLLIDAGPDLAAQCRDPYARWDGLSYPSDGIVRCDGVLLTHVHADHCHGLNELRHLNRLMRGTSIAIHGEAGHLAELERMFGYCFGDPACSYRMANPALVSVPVQDFQTFECAGLPVLALPASHGPAGRVTAWRCGRLGYCTDCKSLPEETLAALAGIDLLVLGLLREQEHPTHMNRVEALAVVERLRPARTVFVHMGHELRYADMAAMLPAGCELAYDGLVLPFAVAAGQAPAGVEGEAGEVCA